MQRSLFFILIGLGGAAILIALGVWQVQRLVWKQSIISDIETRIAADPAVLPEVVDATSDAYLPVRVTGNFGAETLRVLVSQKDIGAGYRLITPMQTGGRRVLVDRGFIPVDQDQTAAAEGQVTVTGNLQWPQETDSFTPEPDVSGNVWFARDLPLMAEALKTDPLMIVARAIMPSDPVTQPLPVDTSRIPNDHLQYAVTWFSLAALWLAMSLAFVLRRKRNNHIES